MEPTSLAPTYCMRRIVAEFHLSPWHLTSVLTSCLCYLEWCKRANEQCLPRPRPFSAARSISRPNPNRRYLLVGLHLYQPQATSGRTKLPGLWSYFH